MICCLFAEPARSAPPGALEDIARACSPRIRACGADAVLLDVSGLSRIIGSPGRIASEVSRLVAARGLAVRVAIADTLTAAWLLARARPGVIVVAPGTEAAALEALPLRWLADVAALDQVLTVSRRADATQSGIPAIQNCLSVFDRWGLSTLGDVAKLPRADLHARMGAVGVRLHQAASGEDASPFVPRGETPRFFERVELEWPVESLEPLSFVLTRPCERLSATLERADRGAISLRTSLRLVTRAHHERVLELPAPLRDPRLLKTLILLDLESHPPEAAIDAIEIEAGVASGQIVQGALFEQAVPTAETLATLLARLGALAGESRVGAPMLPDTHDARAVAMRPFHVADQTARQKPAGENQEPTAARPGFSPLRRFRMPIPARVTLDHGAPVHVMSSARGLARGHVLAHAGPWRTSGGWWALDRDTVWDRDEWDLELADGVYRLVRHRTTGQWEVEGVFD